MPRPRSILGTIALAGAALLAPPLEAQLPIPAQPVSPPLPAMPEVVQAGEALADSAAEAPRWDIDVRTYESQARVAHYVEMFSGRARARITDRLERGSRYEPMIRARMRAGGIPEDMYYLALVESGFDNHAYSRAAAVGMWQFMSGTARGMGLRVDSWVDERRDPVKSTGAAVRFLRELRDQFGSLYLAAAAYNGGPGRVSRGLAMYADIVDRSDGDGAFFVLAEKDYLRNETREYVPQLIAAALVAKEPARYGMTLRSQPAFAYDSVRVPAGTPIAAIAEAAGAPVKEVQELNPELLRGLTPPRDGYLARVPVGSAASFDSALAALPAAARLGTVSVKARKGETIATLARSRGIQASAVLAFNPGLGTDKRGRLAAGRLVRVPTAAVAAAALELAEPALTRTQASEPRTGAAASARTARARAAATRAKKVKAVKSPARAKKPAPAKKPSRSGRTSR